MKKQYLVTVEQRKDVTDEWTARWIARALHDDEYFFSGEPDARVSNIEVAPVFIELPTEQD